MGPTCMIPGEPASITRTSRVLPPARESPGEADGAGGRTACAGCRFFSSKKFLPSSVRPDTVTPSSFMRCPARGTYNKTIQAAPKRQPAQGTFSPDSSLHRLSPAGEKRPPGCTPNAGQGTGEGILKKTVPGKGPKRPSCGQVLGRLHRLHRLRPTSRKPARPLFQGDFPLRKDEGARPKGRWKTPASIARLTGGHGHEARGIRHIGHFDQSAINGHLYLLSSGSWS